jgi:hypothetical protein
MNTINAFNVNPHTQWGYVYCEHCVNLGICNRNCTDFILNLKIDFILSLIHVCPLQFLKFNVYMVLSQTQPNLSNKFSNVH